MHQAIVNEKQFWLKPIGFIDLSNIVKTVIANYLCRLLYLFVKILVCQIQIGYEGVKAAVAAMEGKDLGEKYVDTGVSVITKKNMADFL